MSDSQQSGFDETCWVILGGLSLHARALQEGKGKKRTGTGKCKRWTWHETRLLDLKIEESSHKPHQCQEWFGHRFCQYRNIHFYNFLTFVSQNIGERNVHLFMQEA